VNSLRPFSGNMPLESSMVTVILIRGNAVFQGKSKTDKRLMANEYHPGDKLIAVWTGQYSSDAFELPYEQLLEV
jgi:hypothetical protein